MDIWARAAREGRFYRRLLRTLVRLRDVKPNSATLACDDLEASVDRHGPRTALSFDGRSLTYSELDAMANRYAHWARGRGIVKGDVVAILLPNRIEYLPIWYGLSKVGVIPALINSNITGSALAHSLNVCGASHLISDGETSPGFAAVRGKLSRTVTEWIIGGGPQGDRNLDQALKGLSSLRPTRATARADMTARDVALYIFTSGTTGIPRAAKVTHMRVQVCMRAFATATGAEPGDRIHDALPLCHATGGLCAAGAALLTGATLVIKRRFSASQFWDEVIQEDCTMFVYVGEVCRYLVNQPRQDAERGHRLRLAFGNGLRPDVWEKLEDRFAIPQVLEFYGATEGNVSLLNLDGKRGAVGRVPFAARSLFNTRLVRLDLLTQEPLRDAAGRVTVCALGEVGEVIGRIAPGARFSYSGYADKSATEQKILRNAFKSGDAWFRTGDQMHQDAEGYFYFADRIVDTYRWKGGNVSTSDVEAALNDIPGVDAANVYGVAVPAAEGLAGMAALVTNPAFDLRIFQAKVDAGLPDYARPVFLRLQSSAKSTETYKHCKIDRVAEGFNPTAIDEPLMFRPADGDYKPLDPVDYVQLTSGEVRL